jgi:hypothetical protein
MRVDWELGGRLAVESVSWRLVCVVEKGSLMGTVRSMYLGSFGCGCCDVLEQAHLFAVVVWAVKVGLGCVFKLRLEVWDDISSSMVVCDSRDMESVFIEASHAQSITYGG